jgi:tetratricopeptide (TPR) repeat protein
MNFLKNIFFKKLDTSKQPTQYSEGDIFYTTVNEKFYVYKILVIETAYDGYHVMTFAPLNHKPAISDLKTLKVFAYHSPFDRKAFRDGIILTNLKVKSEELIGYHEYLRQTSSPEHYLHIADNYYQAALKLTDDKKHGEAIDSYSKAIDLCPQFFEAIDNRAFCKMDLGQWAGAIKDFELSLSANPNSLLAEFSIGECYFKMGEFQKAKQHFQKAHEIDPKHDAPIKFLQKLNETSD